MAQSIRQTRLFAAEDYTTVYESYVNADFQAYDYDTIRNSMVEYIRNNYPENYNDWVESSEFVALLDLIAQFGHNLAFRSDLNSRNNFLSTAEKQESVFKLAEFLGYQPKRNVPAFGQMKVVSVQTNEPVIGSSGNSLGGREIRYENTSNINNLDDFVTVMNSVFAESNPFGSPIKQVTVDKSTVEFYNLNNTPDQIYYTFQGKVQGASTDFNAIGLSYDADNKRITEQSPNPNGAFSIIYKNDNRGVTSNGTGFFVGLKQGTLQFSDFNIDDPISSQTLDINIQNVNNSDVWVQNIEASGDINKDWSKVETTYGTSSIYNSISSGIRDIFSVKTRFNNQISINFADKNFGNIPRGLIRVWFRVSENQTYVLRPDDISNKKINIKYTGRDGNQYTASLEIELKESVLNASQSETINSIKENAPRAYNAQDRMITSDDYNNLIQTQSESIRKAKSINRTHSGHSRYLDLQDPTGTYSSLHLRSTDGVLTRQETTKVEYTSTSSAESVFEHYVKPLLDNDEVVNLYYDKYKTIFEDLRTVNTETYVWRTTDGTNGKSGYLTDQSNTIQRLGEYGTNYARYIREGAIIKFTDNGTTYWSKMVKVVNYGLGVDNASGAPTGLTNKGTGAVELDTEIPSGAEITVVYPAFARQFTSNEREQILTFLKSKTDFAIKYDYTNIAWDIVSNPTGSTSAWDTGFTGTNQWLMHIDFDSTTNVSKYTVTTRLVRYSLESASLNFSNINNQEKLEEESRKAKRDMIQLDDYVNSKTGTFYIYGYDFANDQNRAAGIYSTNKVILALTDKNDDNRPDNPDSFAEFTTGDSYSDLAVEWTHYPAVDELIDPSFTNIMDVYVLTNIYDNLYRAWLSNSSSSQNEPLPPTTSELNSQFNNIENKKAMSDSIVYHPVKYKVLFGDKAESQFTAKFRVVKSANTALTDNEIKSNVVGAIKEFFDVDNWDFGEEFYFTELAAHVHKKMTGDISSFVIVPQGENSVFGDLFQIKPDSNEIFIPDVSLQDIDIIQEITNTAIRA